MMENLLNSYNVKNHPTKTELMGLKVLQTYWEHLAFELPGKDSTPLNRGFLAGCASMGRA